MCRPKNPRWGSNLSQLLQQLGGLVGARKQQPPNRPPVLAKEANRGPHSDPAGDPDQLHRVGHPRDPHLDRQLDPVDPDALDPGFDAGDVEAHLGGDVGGVSLLVDQRLSEEIAGDEGMAFRITGDADVGEVMTDVRHLPEEGERVGKLARLVGIAADDENVVDLRLAATA